MTQTPAGSAISSSTHTTASQPRSWSWSDNRVTRLLGTQTPIIQAGMVYCAGSNLAAAAAQSGALGIIGAGSFKLEELKNQIRKAHTKTKNPVGINIPLLYEGAEHQINLALEEGIRIFITSAGSPKKWTPHIKSKGGIVIHVTSTPDLAKKCEDAGVDAVVAEGFEAGGHNGRDEITTLALIPQVVDAVKIPVIAAGGIANGRQIHAAIALGAEGVQIGTRYVATVESSAHEAFKQAILKSSPGDTRLLLKKHVPVRLLRNKFFDEILKLEESGASSEELQAHLGKGRARRGMLEGDLAEGELEIGQVSALIKDIPTCQDLMLRLKAEFDMSLARLSL
jgi:enoyl-[acyl-carrier protein] reductase II